MNDYSRIFNLGGKQYLYTSRKTPDDVHKKILYKSEYTSEFRFPIFNPVFEKVKYGEDAYSYHDYKGKLAVFADNLGLFNKRTTFNVTKQLNNNQDVEYKVGKIKNGEIIPATNDIKDLKLLKKFKALMKKF